MKKYFVFYDGNDENDENIVSTEFEAHVGNTIVLGLRHFKVDRVVYMQGNNSVYYHLILN